MIKKNTIRKNMVGLRLGSNRGNQTYLRYFINLTLKIPTSASNTKQSLNVIKSRISDLQRNKSALENRMKSFEERMKQKRVQQD